MRLVDVVDQGRFCYRLVGNETRQQHKFDPTGRYLDEVLSPPSGPRIIEVYTECVRERRPIYIEHEFIRRMAEASIGCPKRPLSEDGIAVSQVLVFHVLVAPASPQLGLDLWAQPYRSIVHRLSDRRWSEAGPGSASASRDD